MRKRWSNRKSRNCKQSAHEKMANITANEIQFHLFLCHKHRHTIHYWFRENNQRRRNTIMLMLRMREFADRKLKMHKKKCAGPGLVTLKSRGTSWLRILLRWAHLLHRSTSETGGSVLNYDFEYILLHYAIGFYIPLTFVFGLTGKLHPAKKNRQLLLMNCRAGEEVGEIHCNTNALDIISWK